MKHLEKNYPLTHQRLERLPPHAVEHIAQKVLHLSQVNVNPRSVELDNDAGIQAIEKAEGGGEKLSDLLHEAAQFVELAHDELVTGLSDFFDYSPDYVEEHIIKERVSLFERAKEMLIDHALNSEDTEANSAIEALLLLEHMHPSQGRINAIRDAVQKGLTSSLLRASRTMQGIINNDEGPIGISILEKNKKLIQLFDGKMVDTHSPFNGSDSSELLDWLAIISVPHLELETSEALQLVNALPKYIEEKVKSLGTKEDLSNWYRVVRSTDFEVALEIEKGYEDPTKLAALAAELELDYVTADRLLGMSKDEGLKAINYEIAQVIRDFKHRYPEHLIYLTSSFETYYFASAAELLGSMDQLALLGLNKPRIVSNLLAQANPGAYVGRVERAIELLASQGKKFSDIEKSIKFTSWGGAETLIHEFAQPQADQHEIIERLFIELGLSQSYREGIKNADYPLSPNRLSKLEIASFPQLSERMERLGLEPGVCKEIFASWNSYSALRVRNQRHNDNKVITSVPSEEYINWVAQEQVEVVSRELVALEQFARLYDEYTLNIVISTFGIHHFARYSPEDLADQCTRWHRGDVAQRVVVKARADWNGVLGVESSPKEKIDAETFVFEANSASEIAKVAIKIGRYERSKGREPDVSYFIIEAHGNSESMTIGVDGENINTSMYREAAIRHDKIGAIFNNYIKHLGLNFTIILYACSAADSNYLDESIRRSIDESHKRPTAGSKEPVSGYAIKPDGTVVFINDKREETRAIMT